MRIAKNNQSPLLEPVPDTRHHGGGGSFSAPPPRMPDESQEWQSGVGADSLTTSWAENKTPAPGKL